MSNASTLKSKTAKGLLWGTLSNGAQQVLTLVFGIWLARMLSTADYGMVGQLTIFSLIASTIQESGFTAALVNRPTIEHRDYNAVFWFSLPASLLLYTLLFFAAPFIADYYRDARLIPLSRYLFLSFIISSMSIAPSALLLKQMKVREKTLSNLIAMIVSGIVGITLAYHHFEYWGIATQTLVYVGLNTALYWWFARWHPTFQWDFSPVRQMFGFSSRLLITNLVSHINNNFFSLILGRVYNAQMVGNYTQANKWNFMGHSVVTGIVNGVAQPLFVETQDDRERQERVFRKMLRFTCFLAFPIMFGLSIISRELILIALGEKWEMATRILMLLCISGAFLPASTLYTQFLLSRGRSGTYMWGLIAMVICQLIAAIFSAPFGVMVMLLPYIIINFLWVGVWHFFVRQELCIGYWQVLCDIAPFLLVSVGVMGGVYLGIEQLKWSLLASLLAKIVCAAPLYPLILWTLHSDILQESIDYLLKKRRKV